MLSAVFWALWRRIYGEGKITGWLGNRGVQSGIGIGVLIPSFYVQIPAQDPIWKLVLALIVSCWLIFEFFSRAVGEILDNGSSTIQDASSYDRWFRIPLDKVYDHFGLVKYTGFYDWWYSMLRYGLPMIPMCYFSIWFLVVGLLVTPVYWGSEWIYKKFPSLRNSLGFWLDDYKNLAEIFQGFLFGLVVWYSRQNYIDFWSLFL